MEVTSVKLDLVEGNDRLKAFLSMTFDDVFVVHDMRLISGAKGMFLAMPCKKLARPCERCTHKNYILSRFCNNCGVFLNPPAAGEQEEKRHVEVAHPIDSAFRKTLEGSVFEEYAVAKGLKT